MEGKETPGRRLAAHREAAGLTLDDVSHHVRAEMPRLRFSRDTLRRWENGLTPEGKWNPLVVAVLADIYGVSPSAISPLAAQRLERLPGLLKRTSP